MHGSLIHKANLFKRTLVQNWAPVYNDALGHKLICSYATAHCIHNLFYWIKRKVMGGSFKDHIKDTHARDQLPQLVAQIPII